MSRGSCQITGVIRLFGKWKGKVPKDTYDAVWSFVSKLPWGPLSFAGLTEAPARRGFETVAFKNVDFDDYDVGPAPPEPK